jgi:hypothetical protein
MLLWTYSWNNNNGNETQLAWQKNQDDVGGWEVSRVYGSGPCKICACDGTAVSDALDGRACLSLSWKGHICYLVPTKPIKITNIVTVFVRATDTHISRGGVEMCGVETWSRPHSATPSCLSLGKWAHRLVLCR